MRGAIIENPCGVLLVTLHGSCPNHAYRHLRGIKPSTDRPGLNLGKS
jgi:hypothetical protein